jgi:hypothetical protein
VHAARPQIFFHEEVKSARNTKILPPEKCPLYGTPSWLHVRKLTAELENGNGSLLLLSGPYKAT